MDAVAALYTPIIASDKAVADAAFIIFLHLGLFFPIDLGCLFSIVLVLCTAFGMRI